LAASTPWTRPEIAAACGLSRPTVFGAIDRLEALGLAARVGRRSGAPGRSAALYAVPADVGCIAGIDIGGVNLRVEVCDVRGESLAEARRATRARGGASVVRQAVRLLDETIAAGPGSSSPLLAVGVSVPGVVDTANQLVRFAWNVGQERPYDFYSRLATGIDAPILLENNVNLAAIGEQWRGAARELDTFAVIAVGAGVGAGIVHNGTLFRGAHGAAGEVAFLPFDEAHRRGSPATEDDAGGVALLRESQARTDWRDAPPRDVAELFDRAAKGEQPAAAIVEDECRRIGQIITAVCAVVDPEAVILTGGVGANDLLIEHASEFVAQSVAVPPSIVRSGFGEHASLVGAVAIAVEHAHNELLARLDAIDSSPSS
jgi:predicted NBD/HSP70 family sugar kinase